MGQWPPSPSVEDEDTALAHEHSMNASIQGSKSEDQPVQCRGSIDQYPIIVDSPVVSRFEEKGNTEYSRSDTRDTCIGDVLSSDDSAGPPTPPPLLRKDARRTAHSQGREPARPPLPAEASVPCSKTGLDGLARGRPQVTRIQTDVGGDVRAMASGARRPPSPYSYSRTSAAPDVTPPTTRASESFLSPQRANDSPGSFTQSQRQTPTTGPRYYERTATPTSGEGPTPTYYDRPLSRTPDTSASRRTGQDIHSSSQSQPAPRVMRSKTADDVRRSYYDMSDQVVTDSALLSPPRSRRQSKESTLGSSGEEKSTRDRTFASRRYSRVIKDSPYTSSAEDSAKEHRYRSERTSSDEQRRLRRKSSHRRERPYFTESGVNQFPQSVPVPTSAIEKPESRLYRHEPRERNYVPPMTPITSDASKIAMEDYFARAFHDNAMRRSQSGQGPCKSGSTLASPLTSPPRTPKSERQSRDYFNSSPALERPIPRSRPPSTDEVQLMDLKQHTTLLSAATAGATYAARGAGSNARSTEHSTETSSSASTSKPASGSRSRRGSPVREEVSDSSRLAPHSPVESRVQVTLTPTYDARPGSRESFNHAGSAHGYTHAHAHPQPHRALSYSGPDRSPTWHNPYQTSTVSSAHPFVVAVPSHANTVPQPRSARTSVNPIEAPIITHSNIELPVCPRPQPIPGYRDWYTIKDMSEVDICPTCMSVVGNTKYRSLFVPSLPRPYNEPSVCAMSKTWFRIAFLQSLKQNRSHLSWIRRVMSFPRDVKPCNGGKPDVRRWYTVNDPNTKEPVPGYFACSACVHVVDQVFPRAASVFDRPKSALNQERTCGLHVSHKHFHEIVYHLEDLERRYNGRNRSADIEPLARLLKRAGRYRPCPRSEMQSSRLWHYLPDLPELTICEECYDDVVWPLNDKAIARDITKTLKQVPARRGSDGTSAISCQLYSERMRKIFRDCIADRRLGPLKDALRLRVGTHQRLVEMKKLYEQDSKYGIDRRADIERNELLWRSFE